jgi:hypothetical protein
MKMGSLYSKTTHVANAYDKDIWVHVGGDQWYMKSASDQGTVGNITLGVDFKFEWDKVIRVTKRTSFSLNVNRRSAVQNSYL